MSTERLTTNTVERETAPHCLSLSLLLLWSVSLAPHSSSSSVLPVSSDSVLLLVASGCSLLHNLDYRVCAEFRFCRI